MQSDETSANQMGTRPYLMEFCGSAASTYPHLSQSSEPLCGSEDSAEGGFPNLSCTFIGRDCGSAADSGSTSLYEALPVRQVQDFEPQSNDYVHLYSTGASAAYLQNHLSRQRNDVVSGPFSAVATGQIHDDFPQSITGPNFLGASHLGITHVPIHDCNNLGNIGPINSNPGFLAPSGNYPTTLGGQDAMVPTRNWDAYIPNAAGYHMNTSSLDPSMLDLQPSNSQWIEMNGMGQNSSYYPNPNHGIVGNSFPSTADHMNSISPFMSGGVKIDDDLDWVGIDTMNNSMFPSSIAPVPNTLQQGLSPVPQPPPAPAVSTAAIQFPCNYCQKSFKRDADRVRHENSKHTINAGAHLCQVTGCSKSQGRGYTRADKLTEHMWKKHNNLGYAKRT